MDCDTAATAAATAAALYSHQRSHFHHPHHSHTSTTTVATSAAMQRLYAPTAYPVGSGGQYATVTGPTSGGVPNPDDEREDSPMVGVCVQQSPVASH